MEHLKRKSCYHQGRIYSDGAQICTDAQCIVCRDGDWQDSDERLYHKARPSLAYFYH